MQNAPIRGASASSARGALPMANDTTKRLTLDDMIDELKTISPDALMQIQLSFDKGRVDAKAEYDRMMANMTADYHKSIVSLYKGEKIIGKINGSVITFPEPPASGVVGVEFVDSTITPEQEARIREIIREEVGKVIMDIFDGKLDRESLYTPGIDIIVGGARNE